VQRFSITYPNIKNCLHVFDHTIKPILLYGSEIWGCFKPFKKVLKKDDISFDKIYPNLFADKLHIKFCKFILGVNKKATNFAVLSELGRFPLHFDIIKSKIRYWYRLENLGSSFPLLKEAYLDSKSLLQSKIPSWYGSMNFLLQNIKGISDLATTTNFRFNRLYRKSIYQFYEEQWRKQRKKQADGKLCSYICFKTNFGLEKYLLLLKNSEQRKNLTRLRISAHRLHIEQGRYQGIPCQNRICNRCTSNEIDDEVHFLFSCTSSQDDRYYMNSKINSLCSNFNSLNSNQKLIWLLNTENVEILISVCNLISKSKI